jgi:hypothetical protein
MVSVKSTDMTGVVVADNFATAVTALHLVNHARVLTHNELSRIRQLAVVNTNSYGRNINLWL